MSSNIEIKKKCKWCGQIFIARKTTTNYCSHRCNNAAYKERIRQERIATYQKEFSIKTEKPSIEDKEFYTPPEAAKLLRISRASIYRYMADNIIKVVQFKGKTLVRRKDIELLFENAAEYKKRVPIEKAPITDFYTTAELSIVVRPTGARNILTLTLPRKPRIQTLPNGTAPKKCRRSSA